MRILIVSLLAGVSLLTSIEAQVIVPPAAPVPIAKYFGKSGGSTSRYYWVQAIFPNVRSPLSAASLTTTISSLSQGDSVQVSWKVIPGAIAYDVLETSTSSAPTGACNCALVIAASNNSARDVGAAYQTYTVNMGYVSNSFPVSSNTATDTATLSVAQVTGGLLVVTPTAGATLTTPTATALIAAIPNCYIGASFPLIIKNTAGSSLTVTMAGGTNVTLVGTGTSAQNTVRNLLFVVTACTGTPALNMVSLTTGAF